MKGVLIYAKKKILVVLTMLLVTLHSMAFTSMAAETNNSSLPVEDTITVDEFEELMVNMDSISKPRITTCCDGRPNLVWRHTKTMHIYEKGGGPCLSLAYFGDQYCTKCGAVWQEGICYKQTDTGCGQYHY